MINSVNVQRAHEKKMSFILSGCCCRCQVTSVMSDSVQPHRQQPTRIHRPWDFPAKNTGVGCHFLLQGMKVKNESEVAHRVRPSATPWTAAFQARVLEWGAIAFSDSKVTGYTRILDTISRL